MRHGDPRLPASELRETPVCGFGRPACAVLRRQPSPGAHTGDPESCRSEHPRALAAPAHTPALGSATEFILTPPNVRTPPPALSVRARASDPHPGLVLRPALRLVPNFTQILRQKCSPFSFNTTATWLGRCLSRAVKVGIVVNWAAESE